MLEFAALIERAVRAGERSDSLAADATRLRSLAQMVRAGRAGFKLGDEWIYLDAVGRREQQIAQRLLLNASHGICPTCFEEHTARRR